MKCELQTCKQILYLIWWDLQINSLVGQRPYIINKFVKLKGMVQIKIIYVTHILHFINLYFITVF